MLTVLFCCSDEELLRNSAAGLKARAHKAQDSEGPTLRTHIWILLFHSGLLQGNLLWLFSPLTSKKPVHSSRKQHLAPCLQPLAKTGSAFCLEADELRWLRTFHTFGRGWKRGGHMHRAEPTPVQGEGDGSSALCDVPKSSFPEWMRIWAKQTNWKKEKKRKGLSQQTIIGGSTDRIIIFFFQLLYFYFVCVF